VRLHPQQAINTDTTVANCKGIEYVELCTSNAVQAAYFYRAAFGFEPTARSSPESAEVSSILMRSGEARLILRSPLREGPLASHLTKHGEGVRDIALRVGSVEKTFEAAVESGADVIQRPELIVDDSRTVKKAVVRTCGSIHHTLLEYASEFDAPAAGLLPINAPLHRPDRRIERIDHVAIGVEHGTLDRYCEFYCKVLGLKVTHTEQVITRLSAMNSKVVQNEDGAVTFSIVEPLPAARRSQVEEFLDYNHGPGAQHVAFACRDIIRTVKELRDEGIEFLATPAAYYAATPQRVGTIKESLVALQDLGILVDRDEFGYLLQIFSKPMGTVPTFFVEIIQRCGAKGFGSGNIRALFEALEREQAIRQTL